ncbi:MAG: PEGA domain-containing protein [Candidatus Aminicenantes bacterium]|nr:PEGA domain-containing protein [Candidatus Aminicenantes bacterium]
MKKTVSLLVLIPFVFMLSNCATIFKGEFRDVSINSEPGDAQVYINGEFQGRTPLKLELRPDEPLTIEFRREGYKTEVRRITNKIGVGWIVLDVVAGLVPVLVDALTGAWYEFDQRYVNAILERQQPRLN